MCWVNRSIQEIVSLADLISFIQIGVATIIGYPVLIFPYKIYLLYSFVALSNWLASTLPLLCPKRIKNLYLKRFEKDGDRIIYVAKVVTTKKTLQKSLQSEIKLFTWTQREDDLNSDIANSFLLNCNNLNYWWFTKVKQKLKF